MLIQQAVPVLQSSLFGLNNLIYLNSLCLWVFFSFSLMLSQCFPLDSLLLDPHLHSVWHPAMGTAHLDKG